VVVEEVVVENEKLAEKPEAADVTI